MQIKEKLTFSDVLLEPKYSEIKSRSQVDLSVELVKGIKVKLPYIPANMSSISGKKMLGFCADNGMIGIMHRFVPMKDQINALWEVDKNRKDIFNLIGVSVGVKAEDKENVNLWVKLGVKIITIDIAHAHSINGIEMTNFIAKKYPDVLLIVGNVATADGAGDLFKAGADVVKIGIGSGSICSTRLETGNGSPQLSAVIEAHERRLALQKELGRKLFLISDGGHSITADVVKSLCFTDLVMLGGMFSGTDETPGELINNGNNFEKRLKQYHGSSTHKADRIEGVKGLVLTKGPMSNIVKRLNEGLQSGCSYQNCKNLNQLKENPSFIRITNAGLKETAIHDIAMVEK